MKRLLLKFLVILSTVVFSLQSSACMYSIDQEKEIEQLMRTTISYSGVSPQSIISTSFTEFKITEINPHPIACPQGLQFEGEVSFKYKKEDKICSFSAEVEKIMPLPAQDGIHEEMKIFTMNHAACVAVE